MNGRAGGGLRAALAGAVAAGVVALGGCASVSRPAPGADPGCRDGEYRGSFRDAANPDKPRNFRMSARVCAAGPVLLELRGAVGGAALVAAVRPGEDVRLIVPGRRIYVDGPDTPEFWSRWTGAALDGRLLGALYDGRAELPAPWTGEIAPPPVGERLPARVAAASAAGDRLVLEKTRERPAAGAVQWPAVPDGFRHAAEGDAERSGPAAGADREGSPPAVDPDAGGARLDARAWNPAAVGDAS